jgi:hypothetical protein
VERVTPAQPSQPEPGPPQRAVQLHRLQRVRAARWVEPAPRPEQRAHKLAVTSEQQHEHPRGGRPRSASGLSYVNAFRPDGHPLGLPPCRRSKAPITRSRSAARSAWQAVAARGLARTTSRLPPGSTPRYPRARCRSRRRTLFRATAVPTARLTTKPTNGLCRDSGATSRCPETSDRPARLPRLVAASKSARRRIRADAGSIALAATRVRPQTLTRARPFRRRADRMARPARVRMRSRKPCVFARRRLFGWNVRLLTGTPDSGRSACSGRWVLKTAT